MMKGRVMLSGPPGAGKTYTALTIATVLVGPEGRILVIDSEKESSLTYADVFDFEQLPWNPPFDPTSLSLTLKEAAADYDAIIVDSFSHWWRKQGGVLDIAAGDFRGWKDARPVQENLIETILDVDAHVIVCCRSKIEHVVGTDDRGRTTITKAGVKAQQDDDLEYEVNVALEVDMGHTLTVAKSRTNAVPTGATFLAGLGGDFAQQYREWLAGGEPVASKKDTDALRDQVRSIEDDGLRARVMGGFLDTFGRPEFLLVSRLPQAQAWVTDAIAGTLPPDRAEDDTPPEAEPGEGGGAAAAPVASPAPEPAAGTTTPEPAQDAAHGDPDVVTPPCDADASTVDAFEGGDGTTVGEAGAAPADDTGYCATCGGPIWWEVNEALGSYWRHADDSDEGVCVAELVEPAGPGIDVEALYAATHTPSVEAQERSAREASIEAEVNAMPHAKIVAALKDHGQSVTGTPRTLKARWLAYRVTTELDAQPV
jgi:hypothetical protein